MSPRDVTLSSCGKRLPRVRNRLLAKKYSRNFPEGGPARCGVVVVVVSLTKVSSPKPRGGPWPQVHVWRGIESPMYLCTYLFAWQGDETTIAPAPAPAVSNCAPLRLAARVEFIAHPSYPKHDRTETRRGAPHQRAGLGRDAAAAEIGGRGNRRRSRWRWRCPRGS